MEQPVGIPYKSKEKKNRRVKRNRTRQKEMKIKKKLSEVEHFLDVSSNEMMVAKVAWTKMYSR